MDGFPRHNCRDCYCKGARGRGQNGRMLLLLVQKNQDQGGVRRMGIGWEGQHVVGRLDAEKMRPVTPCRILASKSALVGGI